jgi:hypothetical protein
MGGGGVFQKPNVGFGVGVKPSSTIGSMQYPSGLHPRVESGYGNNPLAGARSGKAWGYGDDFNYPTYENQNRNPFNVSARLTPEEISKKTNVLSASDLSEAEGRYDRAEGRRQEKLDAMAGMGQGKGGGGGGVSGQIVGDGGDLNIQHTPMERGKDGFPTLADFEQPLHPFMGKRKLNLKGYA